MKNLFKNKLMMLAIAATAVFATSCGGGDTEPTAAEKPSVSVSATVDGTTVALNDSVEVGQTIDFKVVVDAPKNFNVLYITDGNDKQLKQYNKDLENPETSRTETYSYTTGDDEVNKTLTFKFFAQDAENVKSEVQTFVVNVKEKPSPTAKAVAATKLAVVLGDGTSQSFYSIADNKLYTNKNVTGTSDPVSKTIDLAYYYGGTNKATIVAPKNLPTSVFDISSWGTRKATKFASTTLTSEKYAALKTVEDVNNALDGLSISKTSMTNLTAGTIFAFQTDDTNAIKGFIKVTEVKGTFNKGDYISLEFITNQPVAEAK